MNPLKADEKAKKQWGDKLDLTIKNHKFGYLREHDPKYVTPGTMKPAKKVVQQKKYKI